MNLIPLTRQKKNIFRTLRNKMFSIAHYRWSYPEPRNVGTRLQTIEIVIYPPICVYFSQVVSHLHVLRLKFCMHSRLSQDNYIFLQSKLFFFCYHHNVQSLTQLQAKVKLIIIKYQKMSVQSKYLYIIYINTFATEMQDIKL